MTDAKKPMFANAEAADKFSGLEKRELAGNGLDAMSEAATRDLRDGLVAGLEDIRAKEAALKGDEKLSEADAKLKASLVAASERLVELVRLRRESKEATTAQASEDLSALLSNVKESFRILEESKTQRKSLRESGAKGRKLKESGESLKLEDVNLAAFVKVFEGKSGTYVAQFAANLKGAKPVESHGDVPGNSASQMAYRMLTDAGYKFNNWFLTDKEIAEVVRLAERTAQASAEHAPKALEFLLDEDWSGHVTAGNAQEAQRLRTFLDPSGKGVDRSEKEVADSITRVTGKPFSQFAADPVGYKQTFLREIRLRQAYGIPITSIVIGKEADFRTEQRKTYEKIASGLSADDRKKIDEAISDHKEVKKIIERLDPSQREGFLESIRMSAVSVIVGTNTVIGVGFDVSKATAGVIDTLVVGLLNGKPLVGVSKNIAKGKDGNWSLDFTLGFSEQIGIAPGLRLSTDSFERDNGTAGLRRAMKKQSEMFDAVAKKVSEDPSSPLTDADLEEVLKDSKNGADEEAAKAKLREMHASLSKFVRDLGFTDENERKAAMAGIREAYRSQVMLSGMALKGNDGFVFTGFSPDLLGLAKLSSGALGLLLFVIGSLKFERFKPVERKESKFRAYEKTESQISAKESGIEIEKLARIGNPRNPKHNHYEIDPGSGVTGDILPGEAQDPEGPDHNVLILPPYPNVDLVVSASAIQVERTERGIYVSGDRSSMRKMRMITFTEQGEEKTVLYLGEIAGDKGKIEWITPGNKITRDLVDSSTATPEKAAPAAKARAVEGIDRGLSESSEAVRTALEKIGTTLSRRSLNTSLQQDIFKTLGGAKGKDGNSNIESTFAKTKTFLSKHGVALPDNLDVGAKFAIIERVYGTFMKDVYLEGKPNTPEAYETHKAKLSARISKSVEGKAFLSKIDAAAAKGEPLTPFLGKLPKSTPENANLENDTRAYVFLLMPLSEFDAFGGRRDAFGRRMAEFSKAKGTAAAEMKKSVAESYDAYMKEMKGSSFVPETYKADGEHNLVTFPVSSQVETYTAKDGTIKRRLIHGRMAPILGSIVMAKRGAGGEENFVKMDKKTNGHLVAGMVDALPDSVIDTLVAHLGIGGDAKTYPDPRKTVRDAMKGNGNVGPATIEFDAVFFKWGDCFNDATGIKDIRITPGVRARGAPPLGGIVPGPIEIPKETSRVTTFAEEEFNAFTATLGAAYSPQGKVGSKDDTPSGPPGNNGNGASQSGNGSGSIGGSGGGDDGG